MPEEGAEKQRGLLVQSWGKFSSFVALFTERFTRPCSWCRGPYTGSTPRFLSVVCMLMTPCRDCGERGDKMGPPTKFAGPGAK